MSINWMRPMGDPIRGAEYTVLLQGTGGVSIAGLQIAKACGMKGTFCFDLEREFTH
jgi:NADPH:quinone reductase-like Zn-dependent oxidoreductase